MKQVKLVQHPADELDVMALLKMPFLSSAITENYC